MIHIIWISFSIWPVFAYAEFKQGLLVVFSLFTNIIWISWILILLKKSEILRWFRSLLDFKIFIPYFYQDSNAALFSIWNLFDIFDTPPPFLVTDTYTYFTPVICARFVCDLLGVCTRKFPAKPPKKPGHLSLTESCISPIIVVYISCSYLLLSFCYYRLFIIIKTFWDNQFLCKIVFYVLRKMVLYWSS